MASCKLCGATPETAPFYTSVTSRCAACHKQAMQRRRAENLDGHRERDRMRYPREREKRLAAYAAYRQTPKGRAAAQRAKVRYEERHPEKRAAHIALGNALRDGRVMRPKACEQCGASGRLHGHHDDYTRPLDVRWLCVACHEGEHHSESEVQHEHPF
ncbi:hypothetical protein [Caldovatus aquaticus]|uniref:HNH endonuclease n=1 Tax=Caldovatus aquaticus TaxID=2865671 RepID=A0ABS7EY95_9PROT|nr:hypothetical protein [Caldovatus aquaticus]MBW8268314.1 hypothetical protein [Caldovatus aquaticus]